MCLMLVAVIIGVVNSYSVPLARNLQIITTIGKIAALIIIILGGFVNLGKGKTWQFIQTMTEYLTV